MSRGVLKVFAWDVAALVVGIVIFVTADVLPIPFKHFFIERDPELSYPLTKPESVPDWLLYLESVAAPLLVGLLYTFFGSGRPPVSRCFPVPTSRHVHDRAARAVVLLAVVQAVVWNLVVTVTVKMYAGRPRPNFFAMCNYQGYRDALESGDFTAYNAATTAGAIGNLDNCLGSSGDVVHARESFPSGHASMSFTGLGFLAWFFFSAFRHRFRRQSRADSHGVSVSTPVGRVALVLAAACLYGATMVAASRTKDYYHFYGDVLTGALFGSFMAWATVNFYGLSFAVKKSQHVHAHPLLPEGHDSSV